MFSRTQKAIIFNCHYNGLSIIQELGQHGIECIAMDAVRSIGTYSKYAQYQKCPDPTESESEFIEFLYSYCAREKEKPVVFPTNDHWAVAISKHKEKLSEVALLCVADWEAVKTVTYKELFYELGKEKKYLTPNTWSIDELKQLVNNDFPLIAKPRFRRIASVDNSLAVMNPKQHTNEILNILYKILKRVTPLYSLIRIIYNNKKTLTDYDKHPLAAWGRYARTKREYLKTCCGIKNPLSMNTVIYIKQISQQPNNNNLSVDKR